jgi:hypothetical protein
MYFSLFIYWLFNYYYLIYEKKRKLINLQRFQKKNSQNTNLNVFIYLYHYFFSNVKFWALHYGAWGRTWLLSASLCRAAQQSERCRRCCLLVRLVSGAAKWLRSLRLCRLMSARQDKVSGHPCIKCSCDTVGRRGDLAKVASWRRLGLGRAEVVSVAWGGPRARRESSGVGCPCPRLGSGEARSCPLSGPNLDLIAPIRPLQLCADGGYQLRLGVLGVPLIMVPDRQDQEKNITYTYYVFHKRCIILTLCISKWASHDDSFFLSGLIIFITRSQLITRFLVSKVLTMPSTSKSLSGP